MLVGSLSIFAYSYVVPSGMNLSQASDLLHSVPPQWIRLSYTLVATLLEYHVMSLTCDGKCKGTWQS